MSKRPGGLTALAVLNFVFGGLLAIIGLIAFLALLALEAGEAEAGIEIPGKGIIYFALLLFIIRVGCMIASGVGYLKQKKFLGRTLGNSYAALALADTVIGFVLLNQGFSVFSIPVYAIVTLVLINTTFKDDFIN